METKLNRMRRDAISSYEYMRARQCHLLHVHRQKANHQLNRNREFKTLNRHSDAKVIK